MLHSLRRFCGFVSTFFLVGVFDCVTHWILNLDYRDLLCISVHFIQHRRQQNAAAHTDKYTCTHAHTCTCTSLIWISIQKSISECASMIDGASIDWSNTVLGSNMCAALFMFQRNVLYAVRYNCIQSCLSNFYRTSAIINISCSQTEVGCRHLSLSHTYSLNINNCQNKSATALSMFCLIVNVATGETYTLLY